MKIELTRSAKLLLAACLALSGGLAWQLSHSPRLAAEETPSRPARSAPLPELGVAIPEEQQFLEISSRPVFAPSRRPPPPPTVPSPVARPVPQPAPTPPLTATLVGIVMMPEHRFALLQIPGSEAASLISEGDEIRGWKVEQILDDRVVFHLNDKEQEILFPKTAVRAPGNLSAKALHAPLVNSKRRNTR
jgi:general secretion pathway protein N